MGRTQASRTAVLVCQGRALAHDRVSVGRFDDPTALALLRDDERLPVERAVEADPAERWSHRLHAEMLTRQAEAMAARTVVIDDAVRAVTNPQLVIVGAGLDGRAWRMAELAGVDVFEVDHPASQLDKQERAASLCPTARSLRFVPVDLTEAALGPALTAAGHDAARPTTWLLEGVIPYLTADDAATTVAAAVARSAVGSRLVMSYQTGSAGAVVARWVARGFLAVVGQGDPMANEPRRSSWTPESVRALVEGAGLRLTDDVALRSLADELSLPTRHLGSSRVAVADRPRS